MSHGKRKKKLDKLEKLLRQNPHGIRILDLAGKLGVSRSTVYDYLNTLDLKGLARYERGIAYPPKFEKKNNYSQIGSELDKIKEGFVANPYDLQVWRRLELLADKLVLQPHPNSVYAEGMKQLANKYGSPIDPMKEWKLRRNIIRETLKRIEQICKKRMRTRALRLSH